MLVKFVSYTSPDVDSYGDKQWLMLNKNRSVDNDSIRNRIGRKWQWQSHLQYMFDFEVFPLQWDILNSHDCGIKVNAKFH